MAEKIDYSKTVNLLATAFPMKADLPVREPKMLEAWDKSDLYNKVRAKRKGRPIFLLHDGPPYANGDIHMGHALNKILKDIVVKYKWMSDYDAPYKPGWDCHGLPIEHALFKELGKNKHQVPQLEFRQKAKAYALKFVGQQRADFQRLGILGEWENPYLTLSNDYEAGILEVFAQLREKGLITRKKKPGYWCAFDETALAEAEVEYADKKSDSVFVRFAVKPDNVPAALKSVLPDPSSTDVLIWTTTPWTLPANVGLAFHPDESYGLLKAGPRFYIVAEKLKAAVAKKIGVEVGPSATFKGRDVIGLAAVNPLHKRNSKAVNADYVTMEDGTGIVHIAPGHGVDDYLVGLKWKLDVLSPVDERGRYTEDVGVPALVGKHVLKDANAAVMEALGENLVFSQVIQHSYPHCWRCKNPIIFRATEQWFLRIDDALRAALLTAIDQVRWEPDFGIHRIKGMVDVRPDWCLSRQRHWGAPIAAFYCEGCNAILLNSNVDKKLAALVRSEGTDAWYRQSADELLQGTGAACASCKGTKFRKETDILDVWFDSGVSWHSVVAQNFSNPKPETVMYLEGSDQHRGWFQTSLIPSVALHGKAPYDVVLTHGFVVDGKGHKMSKSLGNVIAPQEIVKKYGADILRLWVAMSDYRDDVRLSQDILNHVIDMYRRFRNTFRFFLQNTADFSWDKNRVPPESMEEIDRWILSHFEEVKEKVQKAYDNFQFHVVLSELNRFAAVNLSGFYLDALKDRLYCERPNSPKRRSVQTALAELARGMAALLAPLLSFTAEEAYGDLKNASWAGLPESVFLDTLSALPVHPKEAGLNQKWDGILEFRSRVNDVLDRERKAGVLKSSQEASLKIHTASLSGPQKKLIEDASLDWPFLLQMADVSIDSSSAGELVHIKATTHKKCERCWRHRSDVGSHAEHPALCGRCVEAVGSVPASR